MIDTSSEIIAAIRQTINPLEKPAALREILHDGSRKARVIAQETMARVRSAARLDYR